MTTAGLGDELALYCPSLDTAGNATTTLNDLSGNGFSGTLTNMDAGSDWPSDTSNGGVRALDFDGTDDYVDFGTGFATFSKDVPFAIAYWIKTSKVEQIVANKWGRLTSAGWMAWIESGNPLFGLLTSTGGGKIVRGAATVNNDVWRHIACVYSGSDSISGLSIYVDGVLQSLTTVIDTSIGTLQDNALRLGITSGTLPSSAYLAGRIDDLRIFSRVISAAEVTHLATNRAVLGPAPTVIPRPKINGGLINCGRIHSGLIQ